MNKRIVENKVFIKSGLNIFLTLILFFLFFNTGQAQENKDYFFQKLNTFNGLSSNLIQCIFRDSRGFVWIGTPNGLNRYDGKKIKIYHHEANNIHSLPREDVRQITEDKNGTLWIGADYGLMEFNPITEQFNLYQHQADIPNSLSGDHIPVPFVDSKNNLWIGTEKGLQLFDRRLRTFETLLPAPSDSINKNDWLGWTGIITEDKDHKIWCTGVKGLFRFDEVSRSMKLFPFQDKLNRHISSILIDHQGNFWVECWSGGLYLFHPENGQFDPINLKYFIGNESSNLSEWRDPSGKYWLAICSGHGLLFYNQADKKSIIVQSDARNPYSLLDDEMTYLYCDKENLLWIGTKKGLNILDNTNQSYHYMLLDFGNPLKDRSSSGIVGTIYEDIELRMISYLWSGGFGVYDNKWNLIRFFNQIPPSDTSLLARDIFGFYMDNRGIYWITTDNGLVRFDRKGNRFKVFIPRDDGDADLSGPKLMREIIPCSSSAFYIRTENQGIFKFDFIKEKFVQHLIHNIKIPTSLPTNYLRAVLKDDENRLIIVSVNAGLIIYDPERNIYETYNQNPDASIREALTNLYYDPGLSGKTLWLNSAHGLLKYDLQSKQFELFDSRNGLSNDFLRSNAVDKNGNVWVAHNAGISRFDAISHTFTNYSEDNGLVFNELSNNMTMMSDGNIYISEHERLLYFNPLQIKANQNIPQVHINSVQVLNAPYNYSLDSVSQKKSLALSFDQDLITVDFSVLNFSHPNENQFYFRLDKDTIWSKLNGGSVNLARLSPGDYVLYVTGSNDCGVMNPVGDTLFIKILPPYYQTGWFRILILLVLVLFILTLRWRGIKRIKHVETLKTEFNKQLAQAETKALRSQMNPHFIFNSLNSINSFVLDKKHEMASDYLIKFSKLIRLILDNSRSEAITIDKELETLKLYVSLESARFDNKFTCAYQVAEDVNVGSVMIPPMLLQPFVENAIWHGLMQKEGEGTITINIKKQDEEFLSISITDDGIGREKAAELKSKSATHNSHGLKVTSQRIEMMNKLNSTSAHVNIFDLHDKQGNATGTKVELIIPF
jgi:ligand-binding sensor domain-containing protein